MNNNSTLLSPVLFLALSAVTASGAELQKSITVRNTSAAPRHEIVVAGEMPSCDFILCDEAGKEIQYQITHDGKLIFMADVPAGRKAA